MVYFHPTIFGSSGCFNENLSIASKRIISMCPKLELTKTSQSEQDSKMRSALYAIVGAIIFQTVLCDFMSEMKDKFAAAEAGIVFITNMY